MGFSVDFVCVRMCKENALSQKLDIGADSEMSVRKFDTCGLCFQFINLI